MVQDRKEPVLSGIKPERDEIASHQSRINKRPSPPPSRPVDGSAAPSRPAPAPAKSSALTIVALLLAVVGVAGAGFGVWQLQESQAALKVANERITELEARLNLTSTESGQSVSQIHEKLAWADSEIRKLWGVSYDTNRKAIRANTDKLAALEASVKTAAADAKKANELATAQGRTLETLRSQSGEQQLRVTRASEEIDLLKQQLRETSNKVNTVAGQVDNLPARVASTEEAIKAIDAFRRTANSDIQQLKQRLASE